jgi:hypothetical protein
MTCRRVRCPVRPAAREGGGPFRVPGSGRRAVRVYETGVPKQYDLSPFTEPALNPASITNLESYWADTFPGSTKVLVVNYSFMDQTNQVFEATPPFVVCRQRAVR